MSDFNFQEGAPQFTVPYTDADFGTLLTGINSSILSAAISNQFQCTTSLTQPTPDTYPTDQAYSVVQTFFQRGFHAEYDGDANNVTISWDHPEMEDDLPDQMQFLASNSMLSSLSGWFKAGVVYLCMTNGVDLRANSEMNERRSIQQKIDTAAQAGLKSITWGFSIVPQAVITNLYASMLADLQSAGFTYTYSTLTGLFTISWT